MSFIEIKDELINKQRTKEINKLFHLVVKAETYEDILALAQNGEVNFEWVLNNDLIVDIPLANREAYNIYDRDITLTDVRGTVIMLDGNLDLTQTGKNRCKIILVGNSICNAIADDMAMIECEAYQNSILNIETNDYSFGYITSTNNSVVNITSNDNSTIKISGRENSVINVEANLNAFINAKIKEDTELTAETINIKCKTYDRAKYINRA